MLLFPILVKYNMHDVEGGWLKQYSKLSKRERGKFLSELEKALDLNIQLRDAYKAIRPFNMGLIKDDALFYASASTDIENIKRIIKIIGEQVDTYAELSAGDEEVTKIVRDDIQRNPMIYVGRKIKTPEGKIKPVKMVRFFEIGKNGEKSNVSGWYHFDTIVMTVEQAYSKLNEALLINRHYAPEEEKKAITEKYERLLSEVGNISDQYEKIGFEYDKNGELSIKGTRENDIGIKLNKTGKK